MVFLSKTLSKTRCVYFRFQSVVNCQNKPPFPCLQTMVSKRQASFVMPRPRFLDVRVPFLVPRPRFPEAKLPCLVPTSLSLAQASLSRHRTSFPRVQASLFQISGIFVSCLASLSRRQASLSCPQASMSCAQASHSTHRFPCLVPSPSRFDTVPLPEPCLQLLQP